MLDRVITIIAAAALISSTSSAMAGMIGMPMNLKFSLEASQAFTSARAERPADACVVHTDDVLTGPLTAWVC